MSYFFKFIGKPHGSTILAHCKASQHLPLPLLGYYSVHRMHKLGFILTFAQENLMTNKEMFIPQKEIFISLPFFIFISLHLTSLFSDSPETLQWKFLKKEKKKFYYMKKKTLLKRKFSVLFTFSSALH